MLLLSGRSKVSVIYRLFLIYRPFLFILPAQVMQVVPYQRIDMLFGQVSLL